MITISMNSLFSQKNCSGLARVELQEKNLPRSSYIRHSHFFAVGKKPNPMIGAAASLTQLLIGVESLVDMSRWIIKRIIQSWCVSNKAMLLRKKQSRALYLVAEI